MTRKTNTIEEELGLLSVEKRTSYGAAVKERIKGRHNNGTVKKITTSSTGNWGLSWFLLG